MRVRLAIFIGSATMFAAAFIACGTQSFDSGSSDASTADASADAPTDAIDSVSDSAADTSDPCLVDAGYALCDDFEARSLSGIWSNIGCVLPSLDKSEWVSPVQSLLTTDPTNDASCSKISSVIAPTTVFIHCEADVKIDTPASEQFSFFQISDTVPTQLFHAVSLLYTGEQPMTNQPIFMGETAGFPDSGANVSSAAVDVGRGAVTKQWFHVGLTLDYAKQLVTANVAGVQQTLPLFETPAGGTSSRSPYVTVGYSYTGDSGVTVVHYDNVFCEAR